jgi:maltooligosyltrehalose trehalohydrolase
MERVFEHGASYLGEGRCRFRVWAPRIDRVDVELLTPLPRIVPLGATRGGWHEADVDDVRPGDLYLYRLPNGMRLPDPASRHQPHGIDGPSAIVDLSFDWHDADWKGPALHEYVFYELHVGTYTREGTLDAVIPHLDRLRDLGVTAVQPMPIAQFSGDRNWGYDGVFPYAVQNSYGGPRALQRFADACHARGLALVLDVVYNHLGPEGNVLPEYAPYLSRRHRTPWGPGLDYDGRRRKHVRRFFLDNARFWFHEFHADGLRLDSADTIADRSRTPFTAELGHLIREWERDIARPLRLFPESGMSRPELVHPIDRRGHGHDAQWSDDFHHALRPLLTGERNGFFQRFGRLEHLTAAFQRGFVFEEVPSSLRAALTPRRRGRRPTSYRGVPGERFVVYSQNHDQTSNHARGERLSRLVSFEALKLAAAATIHSPFLPLLFMGEEYGETAPFPYFTSHAGAGLADAVRKGRWAHLRGLGWDKDLPDPQSTEVFARARLDHGLLSRERHRRLFEFYRELLRLRRETPSLARTDLERLDVHASEREKVLCVRRWVDGDSTIGFFNLGDRPATIERPAPEGTWWKVLDSADERWLGPGGTVDGSVTSGGTIAVAIAPHAAVLLQRRP